MENVTIVGNLTKDPVYRETSGGKGYCLFTLAENLRPRSEEDEERSFFHTVKIFDGKLGMARRFADTFHKGDRVIAVGRLETYPEKVYIEDRKDPDGDLREVERATTQLVAFTVGADMAFADLTVSRRKGDGERATGRTRARTKSEDEAPSATRGRKTRAKREEDVDDEEF